jgi:uncharacterized protein
MARSAAAWRLLPALMVIGAFASSVHAEPLSDAQAAFDRGRYATALELWKPLAEQGNAHAQVGLGSLYLGGYGVARDEDAAMTWFRKAAEQGSSSGQFNLGSLCYARKDYGAALTWYQRASEQGNALAQLRLARLYAEGLGVRRDDAQAFKWFTIAAERSADAYARTNAAKGRDSAARNLTPDQIARAQRLAREWKPRMER